MASSWSASIKSVKLCRFLAAGVAVLAVAHLAVTWSRLVWGHDYLLGLVPAFDLDTEANIPTWYAAQILFTVALTAALVAHQRRLEGRDDWRGWAYFGLLFALMSMDEAASLHELVDIALRPALQLSGTMQFVWILPAVVLLVVVGTAFRDFFRHLPTATRRRLLTGVGVYLCGAVGIEAVGGGIAAAGGGDTIAYALEVLVEECLEMMGAIVILSAVLRHCGTLTAGRAPADGPASS